MALCVSHTRGCHSGNTLRGVQQREVGVGMRVCARQIAATCVHQQADQDRPPLCQDARAPTWKASSTDQKHPPAKVASCSSLAMPRAGGHWACVEAGDGVSGQVAAAAVAAAAAAVVAGPASCFDRPLQGTLPIPDKRRQSSLRHAASVPERRAQAPPHSGPLAAPRCARSPHRLVTIAMRHRGTHALVQGGGGFGLPRRVAGRQAGR